MDSTLLIGVIGATVVLIAFVLNQVNIWQREDTIYDLFNLIGGVLLMIYAYILKSWPFFVLNLVWAAVSFKDILKKSKPITDAEPEVSESNSMENMKMEEAEQVESIPEQITSESEAPKT